MKFEDDLRWAWKYPVYLKKLDGAGVEDDGIRIPFVCFEPKILQLLLSIYGSECIVAADDGFLGCKSRTSKS